MNEIHEFRVNDFAEILDHKRIPLSSMERAKRNGNYPYYGASGIVDFIDDYIFDGEHVLISEDGENLKTRKTPIAFKATGQFWVNNHAHILQCKESYQASLLVYYFQNLDLNEFISGAVQPKLSKSSLCSIPILLPKDKREQKAIASVLSSLDDKIDLLHRQNKTLEAMAETLFRQWFVEEAEVNWRGGKLGDEFEFTMGQSPPGSSFNELAIGVPMFQGNADFGFRFPEDRIFTIEPNRIARRFDTLISVRAPVGDQNMALGDCCIGRGLAAFRYKGNSSFYTYTFFKLRSLMTEIKKFNDEGTIFGSIGKTDLESLNINIPPSELIARFEQITKPINDRIIGNCLSIQWLQKTRNSLLPKLISGEVRVEYEAHT